MSTWYHKDGFDPNMLPRAAQLIITLLPQVPFTKEAVSTHQHPFSETQGNGLEQGYRDVFDVLKVNNWELEDCKHYKHTHVYRKNEVNGKHKGKD